MSVQSLNPSSPIWREAFPTPRPGDRPRRQTAGEPAAAAAEAFRGEAPEEAPPPLIKADLSGLSDRESPPAELAVDALSNANEFLGAFSSLLTAVGSGDVATARNAATALQLELFGGSGALAPSDVSGQAAQTRMLDDLVALIRFARLGELGSAEASAQLLARDMQVALLAPAREPASAVRPSPADRKAPASLAEPDSLVQGATAAYELLMDAEIAPPPDPASTKLLT